MRRFAFLLVLAALFCTLCTAQEFWEKKDYQQWSEKEARKLLNNGPWTRQYGMSEVIIEQTGRANEAAGRETAPNVEYVVQLRSALPVRQALVRQAQFSKNYQAAPPEQRSRMDAEAAQFISSGDPGTVVVNVSWKSNVQLIEQNVRVFWQQQTLETVRDSIWLIGANGRRVRPIAFAVAPGKMSELEVTFPRTTDNGEPLVGPSDKALGFEFMAPDVGTTSTYSSGPRPASSSSGSITAAAHTGNVQRVFVDWKLNKLTYKGQLAY